MTDRETTCALLADHHTQLIEGVRELLRTEFSTVFVVADIDSLQEGSQRLRPTVTIVDLAIADGDLKGLIRQLRLTSPGTRLIALTTHDQAAASNAVLSAGADGVVLKRCVARDLLAAVDAVLQGETFVTPEYGNMTLDLALPAE